MKHLSPKPPIYISSMGERGASTLPILLHWDACAHTYDNVPTFILNPSHKNGRLIFNVIFNTITVWNYICDKVHIVWWHSTRRVDSNFELSFSLNTVLSYMEIFLLRREGKWQNRRNKHKFFFPVLIIFI